MSNPTRPKLNVNSIQGIAGREIELSSTLQFLNSDDKADFVAHLGMTIGVQVQAYNAALAAISGNSGAVNLWGVDFTGGDFTVNAEHGFTIAGQGAAQFLVDTIGMIADTAVFVETPEFSVEGETSFVGNVDISGAVTLTGTLDLAELDNISEVRALLNSGGGQIWMSPSGNDGNPGTSASPMLTAAAAMTALGGSGTIYLQGGTYTATAAFNLDNAPVNGTLRIARATPADVVDVVMGENISGSSGWTSEGSNVFSRACAAHRWVAYYNNNIAGLDGSCYLFEMGTPERVITSHLPLDRGRTHALPHYRLKNAAVSSYAGSGDVFSFSFTDVAASIAALKAGANGRFFFDQTASRIYIKTTDATSPAANGRTYIFPGEDFASDEAVGSMCFTFGGSGKNLSLEVEGINVFFATRAFSARKIASAVFRDCLGFGSAEQNWYIKETPRFERWNCESTAGWTYGSQPILDAFDTTVPARMKALDVGIYTHDQGGQAVHVSGAVDYEANGGLSEYVLDGVSCGHASISNVFTATNGSTTLTAASAHRLKIGDTVRLTTTTTLPGAFSLATTYYVVSTATTTTFTLSATAGGTAITASSAGTGTHTATSYGIGRWSPNAVLYSPHTRNTLRSGINKGIGAFEVHNHISVNDPYAESHTGIGSLVSYSPTVSSPTTAPFNVGSGLSMEVLNPKISGNPISGLFGGAGAGVLTDAASNQPFLAVYNNSISISGHTTLSSGWDDAAPNGYDPASVFNASNGRWTPGRVGLCEINANFGFAATANRVILYLMRNGTETFRITEQLTTATSQNNVIKGGLRFYNSNAADYWQLVYFASGNAAPSTTDLGVLYMWGNFVNA